LLDGAIGVRVAFGLFLAWAFGDLFRWHTLALAFSLIISAQGIWKSLLALYQNLLHPAECKVKVLSLSTKQHQAKKDPFNQASPVTGSDL
jgi:hypothetical protein